VPWAESHGGVEQSGVEEATVKTGWEETEGEKLELGSGTSYIYMDCAGLGQIFTWLSI